MNDTSGIIRQEDTTIMLNLIPKPTLISESTGAFTISPQTRIFLQTDNKEVISIANLLSKAIQEIVGYEVLVSDSKSEDAGTIQLLLNEDGALGEEGYELSIVSDLVLLQANCPAGLFYGVQTLRQLIPTNHAAPLSL